MGRIGLVMGFGDVGEPRLKLVSIKILGQEATTTEVGSKQTNQAADQPTNRPTDQPTKKQPRNQQKRRPKAAKRQIKVDYERSRQADI